MRIDMSINNRVVNAVTFVACALLLSVRIASGQAPAADAVLDPQLEEAMRAGRPVAGLEVTVATNHLQLDRAVYRVTAMVRIAPASGLATGGSDRSRMDVVATVTDVYGTTVQRLRDQMVLDADQEKGAAAGPVAYAGAFTMLPGRYTVRFLVRDQDTGRIGTADASFVVPNLARTAPRP
jgi:hypothetical protein